MTSPSGKCWAFVAERSGVSVAVAVVPDMAKTEVTVTATSLVRPDASVIVDKVVNTEELLVAVLFVPWDPKDVKDDDVIELVPGVVPCDDFEPDEADKEDEEEKEEEVLVELVVS